MEDSLFSISCPNCRTNLLETALLRFGFILSSRCPYCGSLIHWSRGALTLVVFGLITAAFGAYCLTHNVAFFADQKLFAAATLGLSGALVLLGIIFTHFEETKPKYIERATYQSY